MMRLRTCAGACGLLWKSPLTNSTTSLPITERAVLALPESIGWIGIITPDIQMLSSSLDSLISSQCGPSGIILSLACGYLGFGFAICRGATDCTRMGTTGPPLGENTTGSPETGALNCCLAVSFCRTGSSTLYSPGNSVGG